jgi:hypothetical protein
MAGERPSIRLPVTLQGFLEYTGWEGHAPRDRMAVALEYFQTELPLSYLSLPVEDPKGPDGTSLGPNPWLLPVSTRAPGKPPINLCMLMQTINFSLPVLVQLLPRGIRLKAFRTAHDPPGRLGRYFTLLPASQESLAIPHDQTTARFYEAIHYCPGEHRGRRVCGLRHESWRGAAVSARRRATIFRVEPGVEVAAPSGIFWKSVPPHRPGSSTDGQAMGANGVVGRLRMTGHRNDNSWLTTSGGEKKGSVCG